MHFLFPYISVVTHIHILRVSTICCAQDESELILSSLWHTAALNAKLYPDKLQAYQQCIQVLKVLQ